MLAIILPALSGAVAFAQTGARVPLTATLEQGIASLAIGEQPVAIYRFGAGLPKPFIHPLATPSGAVVTMASPADHVHHRGLMFALGNVAFVGEESQYVVFWGEAGSPERLGHIVHVAGTERVEAGEEVPQRVTVHARNQWRRLSDQALMLTENRRITLHSPPDAPCTMLTWESELVAPTRDIILGPTEGREVSYYGLGLRTPKELDGGEIFNANGKQGEQAVLGDDARWCAYVGPSEPRRGFAMFDHPGNPRHPTGWFVMSAGFGYMTASIVCHEALALPVGRLLRLRYGVCAFDGSPTSTEIETWYQDWLSREP